MTNTGKRLEDEIYNAIQSMLAKRQLPFHNDVCRLRRAAKYYSPQRQGDVNFENVLEVYVDAESREKAEKPFLVVFFECKDHGRAVEVGKIDEMVGRLAHSFGFATKGYIVTRNAFSSGAIKTAESNGIGLIRFLPEDQVKLRYVAYLIVDWEAHHRSIEEEFRRAVRPALTEEGFISTNKGGVFVLDGDEVFSSLRGALTASLTIK